MQSKSSKMIATVLLAVSLATFVVSIAINLFLRMFVVYSTNIIIGDSVLMPVSTIITMLIPIVLMLVALKKTADGRSLLVASIASAIMIYLGYTITYAGKIATRINVLIFRNAAVNHNIAVRMLSETAFLICCAVVFILGIVIMVSLIKNSKRTKLLGILTIIIPIVTVLFSAVYVVSWILQFIYAMGYGLPVEFTLMKSTIAFLIMSFLYWTATSAVLLGTKNQEE